MVVQWLETFDGKHMLELVFIVHHHLAIQTDQQIVVPHDNEAKADAFLVHQLAFVMQHVLVGVHFPLPEGPWAESRGNWGDHDRRRVQFAGRSVELPQGTGFPSALNEPFNIFLLLPVVSGRHRHGRFLAAPIALEVVDHAFEIVANRLAATEYGDRIEIGHHIKPADTTPETLAHAGHFRQLDVGHACAVHLGDDAGGRLGLGGFLDLHLRLLELHLRPLDRLGRLELFLLLLHDREDHQHPGQ